MARMDYLVALLLLMVVVPLLLIGLSRRTTQAGRLPAGPREHGVTFLEPSADQPTPGVDALNQAEPGAVERLPPG